jgi:hypothetical protein
MRKKIIQLPKPHLSYSQIQLWKSDRERYRRLYYDNNNDYKLDNTGLEYGKIVADALEKNEDTGDLLTDSAMQLLKKYDVRDQEISVEIKAKEGSFTVIGRPDTLNSITKDFREYKTGKGAWTQTKADNHPQMIFYAMLIYIKHKVVITKAHLDWIETEDVCRDIYDEDGLYWGYQTEIKPTGRVKSFEVKFTLADILRCIADTINVAKEIEIDFASYVPPVIQLP